MNQPHSTGNGQVRAEPFRFDCATHVFPADEIQALQQRGRWMEALAAGKIAPTTAEQERFLKVDREEAEPETLDERAWMRLKYRREFERDQGMAPPPAPKEDYGIIEWDKEKCWW